MKLSDNIRESRLWDSEWKKQSHGERMQSLRDTLLEIVSHIRQYDDFPARSLVTDEEMNARTEINYGTITDQTDEKLSDLKVEIEEKLSKLDKVMTIDE